MKKVLLLAAVFATLSLASCSNKDEKANNANNENANTENVSTEKTAADYAKEVAALLEQLNNCTNEAEAAKIQEKGMALEKEIEAKGLTEQVQAELNK